MNETKLCKYCGGDIAIRNPTGNCDHLYYPDNVNKSLMSNFNETKLLQDCPFCEAHWFSNSCNSFLKEIRHKEGCYLSKVDRMMVGINGDEEEINAWNTRPKDVQSLVPLDYALVSAEYEKYCHTQTPRQLLTYTPFDIIKWICERFGVKDVQSLGEMGEAVILDACCGGRMFWREKENDNVIFMDNREVEKGAFNNNWNPNWCVKPDLIADFRNMPFPDKRFKMVVYDPPHLTSGSEKSVINKKYGLLNKETWKEDIIAGFNECWRVLDDYGVLIFKWNEANKKTLDLIKSFPIKPLFGDFTGKTGKTIWMTFMKFPNNKPKPLEEAAPREGNLPSVEEIEDMLIYPSASETRDGVKVYDWCISWGQRELARAIRERLQK